VTSRINPRWVLFLVAAAGIFAGCPSDTQEIELAVIVPETGAWSPYGLEIRRGVEIALQTLQEDPAMPAVNMHWQDTASDPQTAQRLLQEAFDGTGYAAIGGVMSAEAALMVPIAEQANKVLISPSASDPDLTKTGGRYFFRVFPSDFDEGNRLAKFAVQDLKLETVAILGAESEFGSSVQRFFKSSFESEGGEVLATLGYAQGSADWAALAAQAIALKPQGIYLADLAPGVVQLINALREAGFKGALLTSSAFSDPQSVATVGGDGIYLTRVAFEADSTDPVVQAFSQRYRDQYGEAPGLFAAHGFDAMMVIGEGLKQAGGDPPNRFWQRLRSLRDFQGATGPIQFDESGDVQKFPQVYLVQEGKMVSYGQLHGLPRRSSAAARSADEADGRTRPQAASSLQRLKTRWRIRRAAPLTH